MIKMWHTTVTKAVCTICKSMVTYQQWVFEEGRKTLKKTEKKLEEVLITLILKGYMIAIHLFDKNWQYQQLCACKDNLLHSSETILMIMDFAENLRTVYDNEIHAAHWNYQQVTIHPCICYYKCVNCELFMTDSVVIISDDLTHDSKAVDKFTDEVVQFLTGERNLTISSRILWRMCRPV